MSRARHGALALLALLAAPAAGRAQPAEGGSVDPASFDEARLFLDPSGVLWVLDDGVGTDTVPWNDVDPDASYLPLGLAHGGVQLRVAALPGGTAPQLDGPLVEVFGFFDLRYSRWSAWRLRAGVALSYQPHSEQHLGGGEYIASSPLALRARVLPISFDFGRWLGLRVGGDVGAQWAPIFGGGMSTSVFGGMTSDLVVLLLDGLLEVGITGGIQWTAIHRTSRRFPYTYTTPEAVIGLTAAYLVP